MTSSRKWTKASMMSRSVSVSGRPPRIASMLAGKLDCAGRVPPELVEHDLGRRVALQVDDDAHALAVRFVADVGNALDPLVLGRLGDLLDQAGLADLIGDRGQDDRAAVAAAFLDRVAARA